MKTLPFSILVTGGMLFWTPVHAQQFKQQGPKLIGTGAIGNASQGRCVALSADGNTALSGGPGDNYNTIGGYSGGIGATWVWVRIRGIWSQQGKLIGTGGIGISDQGGSCALSADGNTAVIGGSADGTNVGGVWVFTRRNGVWTQQGPKLVGSGAVGPAWQGWAVDVSADGNTFIEGGFVDYRTGPNNWGTGAVWVFVRRDGVWSQQGPKLVGSGSSGPAEQGESVALSGDGNTALVGAPYDDSRKGAAWVWTRHGGVWTQQGSKLVGSGSAGEGGALPVVAYQGQSVALSYDGSHALIGGPDDNNLTGAVWAWSRHDGVWTQDGPKLVGSGSAADSYQGGAIAMSADGNKAIIGGQWDANSKGAVWIWARNGGVWTEQGPKFSYAGTPNPLIGFGSSVAMSKAGNTVIVGGPFDDKMVGAAWVAVQ